MGRLFYIMTFEDKQLLMHHFPKLYQLTVQKTVLQTTLFLEYIDIPNEI